MMIGSEPISICGHESRMIPVSTDVGQSGPPTNTIAFAKVTPRSERTTRIARVKPELMPTN